VRKQPRHENVRVLFNKTLVGFPWHHARRVGEAENPGPRSAFAETIDEEEAVRVRHELFGDDTDSIDGRDKSIYERGMPDELCSNDVQAALPRHSKDFSIISSNIGCYELHKDVIMNWPQTVKCFQETQLDRGMIRFAQKVATFSGQHILAGRLMIRSFV